MLASLWLRSHVRCFWSGQATGMSQHTALLTRNYVKSSVWICNNFKQKSAGRIKHLGEKERNVQIKGKENRYWRISPLLINEDAIKLAWGECRYDIQQGSRPESWVRRAREASPASAMHEEGKDEKINLVPQRLTSFLQFRVSLPCIQNLRSAMTMLLALNVPDMEKCVSYDWKKFDRSNIYQGAGEFGTEQDLAMMRRRGVYFVFVMVATWCNSQCNEISWRRLSPSRCH